MFVVRVHAVAEEEERAADFEQAAVGLVQESGVLNALDLLDALAFSDEDRVLVRLEGGN